MSLVYLAHPIDQADPDSVAMTLRVTALLESRVSLYLPRPPWRILHGDDIRDAIGAVNETAQKHADATVALLPDGVTTLGVPAEIERALRWGQPVVICAGLKTLATAQVAEWAREGATIAPDPSCVWRDLRRALDQAVAETSDVLKVKLHGGTLPTRGYPGDAGLDLSYCGPDWLLEPGQYKDFDCGLSIELPDGHWGWLIGRSSTARRGLLVNQAVIDNGYRGKMFAGVTNVGPNSVRIRRGERLAQLVLMRNHTADIIEVDSLSDSERGEKGFGSTGA